MHRDTKRASRIACVAGAAVALAITIAIVPGTASAFCRTSSCPNFGTAAVCTPPEPSDCGVPLYWASPCVGYWLQQDASKEVSFAAATSVFDTAFHNWMNADCGGGTHPHILIEDMGPIACDKQEYNSTAGNANIIMFRDADWPYQDSNNTLALTTVTYDLDTGEIYDADMELNSYGAMLTTGDTGVVYDLPSIAQHETGHFLGLAHSPIPTATMFASYAVGDTSLRTLDPDDIAAICAVYPPGPAIDPSCDTTPRHGFSAECGGNVIGGCCTVAPGMPASGQPAGAFALLGLGALTRLRRRTRKSRDGSLGSAEGRAPRIGDRS